MKEFDDFLVWLEEEDIELFEKSEPAGSDCSCSKELERAADGLARAFDERIVSYLRSYHEWVSRQDQM